MQKLPFFILLVIISITFSGCVKNEKSEAGLYLSEKAVKAKVKDWRVYTNPAYRYELRHPTSWRMETSGEDGKLVEFFISKQSLSKALVIRGISNWKENLTLEQYFSGQPEDLFKANYEREDAMVSGEKAVWFKGVKRGDLPINIIAIASEDRILIIEIWTDWEESLAVLNSIKFYPNKTFDEVK